MSNPFFEADLGSDDEIEEQIGQEMIKLGVTQSELKERCYDLFGFTQPIPFKSSKSELDT